MGYIYKETEFLGSDSNGDYIHILGGKIEKTASEVFAPIRDFVSNSLSPMPGKTYLLVNAMGAMEAWSSNVNNDAFPEKELIVSHTTFKSHGHPFTMHSNKDPKKALGKVVFSAYNPEMKRVELIVELDNEKASGIVAAVNKGEFPRVSMGTRVPYEVCSICGNKNKTLQSRCKHLKYENGIVYPDGRKVMAINTNCTFFDISFVIKPADRTASVMLKVASEGGRSEGRGEPHQVIFDVDDEPSRAGSPPVSTPLPLSRLITLLRAIEPDISYSALKRMSSTQPERLYPTLGAAGIVLKPKEFQTIMLLRAGHDGLANRLYRANVAFSPGDYSPVVDTDWSPSGIDPRMLGNLENIYDYRSAYGPFIAKRLAMFEHGPDWDLPRHPRVMPIKDLSSTIGEMYNGYRISLLDKLGDLFEEVSSLAKARKLGKLNDIIEGSATSILPELYNSESSVKTASAKIPAFVKRLGFIPAFYLLSGYEQAKEMQGRRLHPVENFVAKHPLALSAGAVVGPKAIWAGAKGIAKMASELVDKIDFEAQTNTNQIDNLILKPGGDAIVARSSVPDLLDNYIVSKASTILDSIQEQ